MSILRAEAAGPRVQKQVLRTGLRLAPGSKAVSTSPPLNQILVGDCIEAMRGLPEASVDLVSPIRPITFSLKAA